VISTGGWQTGSLVNAHLQRQDFRRGLDCRALVATRPAGELADGRDLPDRPCTALQQVPAQRASIAGLLRAEPLPGLSGDGGRDCSVYRPTPFHDSADGETDMTQNQTIDAVDRVGRAATRRNLIGSG